jgi:hypothetical protein
MTFLRSLLSQNVPHDSNLIVDDGLEEEIVFLVSDDNNDESYGIPDDRTDDMACFTYWSDDLWSIHTKEYFMEPPKCSKGETFTYDALVLSATFCGVKRQVISPYVFEGVKVGLKCPILRENRVPEVLWVINTLDEWIMLAPLYSGSPSAVKGFTPCLERCMVCSLRGVPYRVPLMVPSPQGCISVIG